jgi:hypothetical protein
MVKITIYDFKLFIYTIKRSNMKNIYDKNKRNKLSITIDPKIVDMIDDKTTNRSSLINSILKEHFNCMGEDVSKIKL